MRNPGRQLPDGGQSFGVSKLLFHDLSVRNVAGNAQDTNHAVPFIFQRRDTHQHRPEFPALTDHLHFIFLLDFQLENIFQTTPTVALRE